LPSGEHIDHTATGGGRVGQGHHEVFRANVDGSDIVRLTNSNAWNNAWVWAPDSKSMIIASDRDGNWELYRMSVNGEQEKITRLTNDMALEGWPSFTPDGKQIVFASDRDDKRSQIFIMNADGTNTRRLTNTTAMATLPSVSPDGRRVVYAVQSGTEQTGITSDIYVMNIDGSNSTRLTRDSVAVNTDPSWSPDGTKIVFSSDRDGNSNIYMINADGTETRRITSDPGEDVTPFWATIDTSSTSGRIGDEDGSVPLVAAVPDRSTRVPTQAPADVILPSSPSARPSYRKRRRP
jgi:Tol biopolymer transport system component